MSKIRFAPLPDRNTAAAACDAPDPRFLSPQSAGRERKPSNRSSRRASSPIGTLFPSSSPESPSSMKTQFLQVFRLPSREESSQGRASSIGSSPPRDNVQPKPPKSPKRRAPSPPPEGYLASFHSPRTPNHRLLNGRVYGKRDSVSDAEPKFVEWGYGGMGSVKSQREVGGRVWRRVQSESGMAGDAEDEDDGSGMSWVRRRKEARQRRLSEIMTPPTDNFPSDKA